MLADFAQLAPDRSASISFDDVDPHTLTVAVCGIAPATSVPEVASRVAVGVQVKVDQAGREIWIPISETELHRAVASRVNPVLWTASIVLPQARGAKPMRSIIKEYERLTADAGDRSDITLTGTAERLVYADVINI